MVLSQHPVLLTPVVWNVGGGGTAKVGPRGRGERTWMIIWVVVRDPAALAATNRRPRHSVIDYNNSMAVNAAICRLLRRAMYGRANQQQQQQYSSNLASVPSLTMSRTTRPVNPSNYKWATAGTGNSNKWSHKRSMLFVYYYDEAAQTNMHVKLKSQHTQIQVNNI